MTSNITARQDGTTNRPYARMSAYQLLQAAKTLVASQHLAALAFTAAHRVPADDQAALVDWAEARMEAHSAELIVLLQEFDTRELDEEGRALRDSAIAISHDVIPAGTWQVSVGRVA